MIFTRLSLNNPVLAVMVMAALVVLGLFSLQRLQVDQFPNVEFPVVVISTDYPGASPEVVETEVTQKIEEAVNTVAGINALTSRSYESQSLVIIEFGLSIDGRKAAEDVREKIATVRPTLRTEVKEPRVLRFDPDSRPIWSLAVQGHADADAGLALTRWADQVLKKRLENVRGVGAVTLVGATPRQIGIDLDAHALDVLGITPDQVVAAVRAENQDYPLGSLRNLDSERAIELKSRVHRPEELGRLVVGRAGNTPVLLSQVAQVRDGAPEPESLALYNGARTLLLTVQKAQDDNTIAVVDQLNQTLTQLQREAPPGVQLLPVTDASRQIRVAVRNVRQTLIEGALLTVLIVFLFLNSWRSTVITGLTLPIALIGTFYFMHLMGFTINMITLMALSLCVGLLIDDAIVVRENIVRHLQMGRGPFDAALNATQEIGLAVLATTLSIVAVFLPIGFMGGIIGKFFHEFGLTIVVAVLISMFVSFTLDPMLSSVWHDPSVMASNTRDNSLYGRTLGRITGAFAHATDALAEVYQHLLRRALAHPVVTMGLAAGVFVISLALIPLLGTEFVPKSDFSETQLSFNTPPGSSLELTERRAREVDAIVRSFPEVAYTLATINSGNAPGKMYASFYIRLVPRSQRPLSVKNFSSALRQRLRSVPGIQVTHVGLLEPVGGQKQISFSIQGPDLQELARLNALALERLRGIAGLVDVDSSLKPDQPTLALHPDRTALADLGLSAGQVASRLRSAIAGVTVGNWRASDDQTYDVVVRLAPSQRSQPADLAALPLALPANGSGPMRSVRLDQVARLAPAHGSTQINRRGLTREVAISANVHARSAGEVSADIRRAMDGIAMPPGYSYAFSGSTKDMAESFAYALQALAMAVIFIYMILASQFRSFLQPLALMTSLPLTLIGVVLALMVFNATLSLFSVIGIVMLMGLVTKNAILLVDFANRARQAGVDEQGQPRAALSRHDALLLAARVRLRPILMTTLAMVFGMLPLALALSEGSEMRAPMGQAVIGGVLTSSVLTLVVVPVAYGWMDDLGHWLRTHWLRLRQPQGMQGS
ncbi:MAG: efflux RND transporter permease subunit [Rhodoferax sp.]